MHHARSSINYISKVRCPWAEKLARALLVTSISYLFGLLRLAGDLDSIDNLLGIQEVHCKGRHSEATHFGLARMETYIFLYLSLRIKALCGLVIALLLSVCLSLFPHPSLRVGQYCKPYNLRLLQPPSSQPQPQTTEPIATLQNWSHLSAIPRRLLRTTLQYIAALARLCTRWPSFPLPSRVPNPCRLKQNFDLAPSGRRKKKFAFNLANWRREYVKFSFKSLARIRVCR